MLVLHQSQTSYSGSRSFYFLSIPLGLAPCRRPSPRTPFLPFFPPQKHWSRLTQSQHVWGLHRVELNPSLLRHKALSPNTTSLHGPFPFLGGVLSPCTWRHHSPGLSSPQTTLLSSEHPSKGQLYSFLANPHYNWLDWFENAWWQPHESLFEDCISQAMSQWPGWCDCTVRCPAIHTTSPAWLHPSWSCHCPVVAWGVSLVVLWCWNHFGCFFLNPCVAMGYLALAFE